VNVIDTTPPDLSVPSGPIVVEATGPRGAAVVFTASAEDIVDGAVTAVCTPSSGAVFPLGTTGVSCSVTDAHNNRALRSFDVRVVDTSPPVISSLSDFVLEAAGPGGAFLLLFTPPIWFDAVDGHGVATCLPSISNLFPIGSTRVLCTARDAADNESSSGFTVTVRDTTAPVILSTTASPGILWPPNKQMRPVRIVADVTDLVTPIPTCGITAVTANDGATASDWQITGSLTLNLRADRKGAGDGRRYMISLTCADGAGNVSTSEAVVTVPHDRER
jgi:hypothetical protein